MWLLLAALALSVAAGADAARAADFPVKPITIIVPYGPGGSNDIVARQVAPRLSATLGQPVVVENKPGANGNIGTLAIARAPADGHVIGVAPTSVLTINPSLYRDMGFDPAKDLAPITIAMTVPNILVVHPSVPATTIPALIAHLKAKPDSLSFASQGAGSTGHLSGELFDALAGVTMTHVPYKGSAGAMNDLVAGQVTVMFDNLPTALPHVQSGKLRALGIGSLQPAAMAPDVPPIARDLPGFESVSWFGFVAPAAVPAPVLATLHKAITDALRAPDVAGYLEKTGGTLVANGPAEMAAVMRADHARWKRVIDTAKVTLD